MMTFLYRHLLRSLTATRHDQPVRLRESHYKTCGVPLRGKRQNTAAAHHLISNIIVFTEIPLKSHWEHVLSIKRNTAFDGNSLWKGG